MTQSALESQLAYMIKCVGLPEPVTQYRLPELPDRKFAWDFAWPVERLLVDVQGGTWVANSGHTSGTGLERDCEKMVLGTLNGYRVMFVTGLQVKDGRAVQ
jgi:uncharacterized membrane protein